MIVKKNYGSIKSRFNLSYHKFLECRTSKLQKEFNTAFVEPIIYLTQNL